MALSDSMTFRDIVGHFKGTCLLVLLAQVEVFVFPLESVLRRIMGGSRDALAGIATRLCRCLGVDEADPAWGDFQWALDTLMSK